MSNKMTVEWHIECLKNRKEHIERYISERDRLSRIIEKNTHENNFTSIKY